MIGLTIASAATLLPHPASHPDLLGYRTLCAFVPVSTVSLLVLAGIARMLRDSLYEGAESGSKGKGK